MVRAQNWASLKPGKDFSLAVMLGTLVAIAAGAKVAATGPGIKLARKLLAAETTIGASADQDSSGSYGSSVSSSAISEVFEACSAELDCTGCLEIPPGTNCKRDTIVNAFHCDDVAEVLCCAFNIDLDCMDNDTLLKAVEELNEHVCSLELSCIDGGIETLNLGGGNAGLLVATGPDAVINPDKEKLQTTVTSTEDSSADTSADNSSTDTEVEPAAGSEGEAAVLTNGAATGTGGIISAAAAAAAAALCVAVAVARLTFLAGGT